MNRTYWNFIKYFGLVLGSGILLLIAGVIYVNHIRPDLTKADKVVGKVTKTAIVITARSTPRSPGTAKAFTFQLDNLSTPLGTHRPGDDYTKLLDEINVGDTLTVYFQKHPTRKLNLDVYQIEKNGRVLQDYESYIRNNKKAIVLFILLGYCLLVYGIIKVKLEKSTTANDTTKDGLTIHN